jgi:signal transduction histidine kinase/ActR/RegA family two-component response regulator
MAVASQVRREEIAALFRQAGAVLWANAAVSVILAGTLLLAQSPGHEPRAGVLLWLGALALLTLTRLWLQRSYVRAKPGGDDMARWGARFVVASISSGLLWGGAGFFFFEPGNVPAQALLTFTIGGMTAAAAGTLSCHLPAFFGYFVCALAPLALRTFLEGGQVHVGMGAMMVAYAVGMQHVARNNHRAFSRAFRLGLENAELVEQLSRSQLELQRGNQRLEERVAVRTSQLEQHAEALRRAQRLELVGKVAGSLAHDFNNLLTVVLSNATLLKDPRTPSEQREAAVDETLQAARRGAGLIRQLLSFSRRQRTEPQVFSLNRLIGESEALLRKLAGNAIQLHIELADEPGQVHADPAQLEQVLLNLVSAACAAMPRGGVLRVKTERVSAIASDCVSLSVEDSGDGTAPRALDAGDPFPASAAEALDRSLGLTVARTIIEQSGGRFLVDSQPNQGTHFRVELPAAAPASEAEPARSSGAPSRPLHATILVVDDEVSLRSVMRRTLLRAGFEVLLAEDGDRALAVASSHAGHIDLLLTDVVMPGLSGPELARRLREARPEIGVLFVSGYSFDENVPAADAASGMGYLAKPFDSTTLTTKVHHLLETRAARSAPGLARPA